MFLLVRSAVVQGAPLIWLGRKAVEKLTTTLVDVRVAPPEMFLNVEPLLQ